MLKLYKRHNCSLTDPLDFSCSCPIWITGRLPDGQLVPRQSTGFNDEHSAKAVRSDLIRRFTRATELQGLPIQRALDEYLASRNNDMTDATAAQYRHVLGNLMTFCEGRGLHYMPQLTVDVIDSFSSGFKGRSTTRAVGMSKVSAFLRDAFRRGWIKEPLAARIKPSVGVYEEKKPYTDREVELILAGCAGMVSTGERKGYGSQPATFRLLLELMLETGMRAGDALRFDPRVLVRSTCLWMYRFLPQKRRRTATPRYLDVYVTDRLKTAVEGAPWLSTNLPFAWGSFQRHTYLANEVYYRMQAIGRRVGVEDCRPHRLRDTFAVRLLAKGLSLDDVSRLLGHSSVKVTEKYYARWTSSRGALLEGKLSQVLL